MERSGGPVVVQWCEESGRYVASRDGVKVTLSVSDWWCDGNAIEEAALRFKVDVDKVERKD